MRWDYQYRDMFTQDVHKDILIVPHATDVIISPGNPPLIKNKIPKFDDKGNVIKIDGDVQYLDEPEFIIDNSIIIKEKFEYVYGLNSGDSLSFGACESSMIKFTIRNEKEYNEDTGKYELVIPDLTKYEEIEACAVIKVYCYLNNDSSTLVYLGMYKVEQDKLSDDSYTREITAYDFMMTLRDMDIFEWYKRLFQGILKDDKDPSKGYVREPKAEWTIEEAIKDLFDNLATYDPGSKTVTNPSTKNREISIEDYPGYGMPILLDPELFDQNAEEAIPDENNISDYGDPSYEPLHSMDRVEHYGYMPAVKLKFRQDDKIISKGALSCGKFLEDIGEIAGRFGFIRTDFIVDGNWTDPADLEEGHKYNLYEKCILTFKPLPRYDVKIADDNVLDNDDLVKGVKHDYYRTQSIKIVECFDYNSERTFFINTGLSKNQIKAYQNGMKSVTNYKITDNTFVTYLELKKKESDYSTIYTQLEGILKDSYNNIRYRTYTPCQFTTQADLCRDAGDMLSVSYVDKITGEPYDFKTIILQCKITGIQKMLATYSAKGKNFGSTFSDYRSGTTYSSYGPQTMGYYGGGGYSGPTEDSGGEITVQGLSIDDFVEIIRNIGFRLLNEPSDVSVQYSKKDGTVSIKWTDPVDITTNRPAKATWAGTVVVRKEGSRPLHRWDGTLIVNSTTRDEYSETALVDDTVAENKTYYYGIFPYDTNGDYRFTKAVKVDTLSIEEAPEIESVVQGAPVDWNGSEVAIMWSGENNKLTVQVSNNQILFKMYTGNTVIYSWTSPVGTSASSNDTAKIHVAFLEDNINQVAKPSFVYHTGSGTYSYNQESPTDAEMGLIYKWVTGDYIIDPTYIKSGANTLIVTLNPSIEEPRPFYKNYSDECGVVIYKTSSYYGCILVSRSADGVKYNIFNHYMENNNYYSVSINGIIWYVSAARLWVTPPDRYNDWVFPTLENIIPDDASYWSGQYVESEVRTLVTGILNALSI